MKMVETQPSKTLHGHFIVAMRSRLLAWNPSYSILKGLDEDQIKDKISTRTGLSKTI